MLVAQPDTVVALGQRSAPDWPVPRWSSTTRSRVASAGAMFSAIFCANGMAAWPGPPARPITAVLAGFEGATARLRLSVSVPAVAPEGSTGTASRPHWKPAGEHGANAIAARADGAATAAAPT